LIAVFKAASRRFSALGFTNRAIGKEAPRPTHKSLSVRRMYRGIDDAAEPVHDDMDVAPPESTVSALTVNTHQIGAKADSESYLAVVLHKWGRNVNSTHMAINCGFQG
jgi:hypothetical protein